MHGNTLLFCYPRSNRVQPQANLQSTPQRHFNQYMRSRDSLPDTTTMQMDAIPNPESNSYPTNALNPAMQNLITLLNSNGLEQAIKDYLFAVKLIRQDANGIQLSRELVNFAAVAVDTDEAGPTEADLTAYINLLNNGYKSAATPGTPIAYAETIFLQGGAAGANAKQKALSAAIAAYLLNILCQNVSNLNPNWVVNTYVQTVLLPFLERSPDAARIAAIKTTIDAVEQLPVDKNNCYCTCIGCVGSLACILTGHFLLNDAPLLLALGSVYGCCTCINTANICYTENKKITLHSKLQFMLKNEIALTDDPLAEQIRNLPKDQPATLNGEKLRTINTTSWEDITLRNSSDAGESYHFTNLNDLFIKLAATQVNQPPAYSLQRSNTSSKI